MVPIPLCGNKVIVGMDRLTPKGEMIDCEQQLVRIRTPSGEELVVQGERAQHGPILCSSGRAKCYIQQVCSGFVAYVMDTQDKGNMNEDDVTNVREYPDMFPKDFPWVPTMRHVEFRIDRVPGASPIAKVPYQLAPPEIQELSTQLQELLDKGFIRSSSSPW